MIIVSWNILANNLPDSTVPAQAERLESICTAVNVVSPDIAAVYELDRHLSHSLAAKIGHEHYLTTDYCETKYGLSMSLSSSIHQESPRVLDLGASDNRKALISTIGGITIVGTHLSYNLPRFDWRVSQVRDILEVVGDQEQAVIMGDFNCLPWQKPRRLIKQAGFVSVAQLLSPSNPATFPTSKYRKYMKIHQKLIAGRGLGIDDIYLKNIDFLDGGLIEGESDHYGIWAKIKA